MSILFNDLPVEKSGLDEKDLNAELRLALVDGVGPKIRRALMSHFGSAQNIFSASPAALRDVPGIGPKICRAICAAEQSINVQELLEQCAQNNVNIFTDSQPAFPRLLKELYDPPGMIFVKGEVRQADNLALAIVGTRHCTHYGETIAERLASGLSHAGYTIVSGLARGIDGAAHRGALKAQGRTIAVLGSGVLNIYPPEHVKLAEQIVENGAFVSETKPFGAPMKGAFPQRNRIISGMSLGVIVVEADINSGALITARHAMEQGREVFAVPGRVDSRVSHGCHHLIRDGAKLVESVDDILEELGPLVEKTAAADGKTIQHPAELQLNEIECTVLDQISNEAVSIDSVIVGSKLPTSQVLSTISVLEMKHLIRRMSGSKVQRK